MTDILYIYERSEEHYNYNINFDILSIIKIDFISIFRVNIIHLRVSNKKRN